jgi:hypothetical protein
MPAGSKAAVASLTADDLERDIYVAVPRTRVGTDFLVCIPHEHGEIGLFNALILDAHLHREPKATVLAHADRYRACYLGRGRIFFLLLGDEIERTAEAGRVACRRTGARESPFQACLAPPLLSVPKGQP